MPARAHVHLGHRRSIRLGRDHRTPGHLPREERRRRPVQRCPGQRMQTIGPDQQRRIMAGSIFQCDPWPCARKVNRPHTRQQAQGHPSLFSRAQQQVDKVRPVQEMIPLPRPQARQIQPNHPVAGRPVDQLHRLGPHGRRIQRPLQPQPPQDRRTVGRNLQPSPYLADHVGLFQHRDRRPPQRQRPRHGKARNPCPKDGDGLADQAHGLPPKMTTPDHWGPGA